MNERPKILYVDDESINLKLFEMNFRKKFEVLTADNGIIGIEMLNSNPDVVVVISDMKMPNMNGIEFIKLAKEKHPDIKFYILTGFEITDEIQEALDDKLIIKYFSKPFNRYDMENAIAEAIG